MPTPGARLWLNVDLGELPGEPEELYAHAHIANVACGGHAGDEASMSRAVGLCLRHGVRLAAHPSYPDVAGFGRRHVPMEPAALSRAVAEQCGRLASIARDRGLPISFVKPHGALYHDARVDLAVATGLVRGVVDALGVGVTLVGPPGPPRRNREQANDRTLFARAAASAGLAYAREGFADRAMRDDGTLVPRDQPGALVLDPVLAAHRATVLASSGEFETICVHGDTPGAVAIARAVREALDAHAGT